jgi:hypothetical protein
MFVHPFVQMDVYRLGHVRGNIIEPQTEAIKELSELCIDLVSGNCFT